MFYQPLYDAHRLSVNMMLRYARRLRIWTGLALLVGTEVSTAFGASILAPLPPQNDEQYPLPRRFEVEL